jgi:hypothetical protein
MKFPIGIQDFRVLREGGYAYVDKTERIHSIVSSGKYFFLSRPRRFGKSLLLSTMNELYSGSRELFGGLWIENRWDWERNERPVIWLKFGSQGVRTVGLEAAIHHMLEEAAGALGVVLREKAYDLKFKELIVKTGVERKTVLLIDEYDKPVIDYLDDIPQAEANREILKSFYSVLKDCDPYLELVFITGVSAFSKVSIFSDLNNLYNLSLSERAGHIVGITQEELQTNFENPLQKAAEKHGLSYDGLLEKVRQWYNGYSWGGENKVYNPFSILSFLPGGQFRNFWFETGTPTFLLRELRKQRYYRMEEQLASELLLNEFDFEHLHPVTVLFQTGYLTIVDGPDRTGLYTLNYPNLEVKSAFQEGLLNVYAQDRRKEAGLRISRLLHALEDKDIESVISVVNTTFAGLPYDHWRREDEHFFHALVHLTFSLLGAYIHSEVHTAGGRCDALVKTDRYIYAFEFKLDRSAAEAIQQIKEKNYLAPYADSPAEKIAVGINFSKEKKQVAEWLAEKLG